jgi:mono/diheme cytochrome c family protein
LRNLVAIVLVVSVALAIAALRSGGSSWFRGDADGRPLAEVRVPPLDADALEGAAIYEAACTSCHGDNAAGRNGIAPPLVHPLYRPGHHADIAFWLAARDGVRSHHWLFGDMPPVAGMTRPQVDKIVAYVRALQRANGIE